MSSEAFLTVGEQSISLSEALSYLQSSGKLQTFLIEILRQHFIEQEIENRADLNVNSDLTEQAVIDFRLQNQLTEPDKFQQWLATQGIDYGILKKRIGFNFKIEALKSQIALPKLQEYFIERKIFLDRVVLSRIIVDNKELAEELRCQIEEGSSFEELAQEYSIADDRVFKGMMGLISRGSMPDQLRMAVDATAEGGLVGPTQFEGRWGLFRVEKIQPASLDDPQVQQTLQNDLFEQWIAEKLRNQPIQLVVK